MQTVPFQRLTVVRLVSPPHPVPDTPEDDAIQAAHIRYLRGLAASGKILVNGPMKRIDDPEWRGMSLYLVGPDEARALAMEDPGVKAGWFEVRVNEWVFPAEDRRIGDRCDFEMEIPD